MVVPGKKKKIRIAKGDEAIIYRRIGSVPHRRIVRYTYVETNLKWENPKVKFYVNLIGKILFPKNFVDFSLMRVPKNWTPTKKVYGIYAETHYPSRVEFYSREVPTSEFHKRHIKLWQKSRPTKKEKRITEKYQHLRNKSKVIARKINELREAGFLVNDHPNNVDLINKSRTPVFFEVSTINPEKIEAYIKSKPLSKTFTKQKKERALRLVKRLKEVWNSIE
jgi:hypothetical protein